jgi:hypothetical protein
MQSRNGALPEVARFALAGLPVSIAASPAGLGTLLSTPFAHLPPVDGEPSLRIEARVNAEPSDGRHRIEASEEGAVITHVNDETRAVLDRRDGVLRTWWLEAHRIPPHERTKPFLICLSLWLADRGLTVAHGGCVARDGRAVLLVGPSGSGKSTAALACAAAGFDFLGDDQVALSPDGSRPAVHSLYGTARLDGDLLREHPELACGADLVETGEAKPVLVLGRSSASLAASAALAALVVVGRGPASVAPVSRASALRALAPSSLARMPLGRRAFERMADVAAGLPAFEVRAPTPGAVPASIESVLTRV